MNILDSKSIDSVFNEKHQLIGALLNRDASLFKICRTAYDVDEEKIKDTISPKNRREGF
jgi:hypothetical protein